MIFHFLKFRVFFNQCVSWCKVAQWLLHMVSAGVLLSRPLGLYSSKLGSEAEGGVPILPSPPNWCQNALFAWQPTDDTCKADFTEEIKQLIYFLMWLTILHSGWCDFPAVERKLQVRLMLRSMTSVWSQSICRFTYRQFVQRTAFSTAESSCS